MIFAEPFCEDPNFKRNIPTYLVFKWGIWLCCWALVCGVVDDKIYSIYYLIGTVYEPVKGYWLFSVLWYWGRVFVVLLGYVVLLRYIVCCWTMQRRGVLKGVVTHQGGITSIHYICKFLWSKCKIICQICFSLKITWSILFYQQNAVYQYEILVESKCADKYLVFTEPQISSHGKKDQFVPL